MVPEGVDRVDPEGVTRGDREEADPVDRERGDLHDRPGLMPEVRAQSCGRLSPRFHRPLRRSSWASRPLLRGALLGAFLVLLACSPVYVVKAGLAEWRILRAREPVGQVIRDPAVDPGVREKLAWALEARSWARDSLGYEVGDIYTTYVELESDTLAHILSAAPVDGLVPRTWWFPIVGRVPYRGYFDLEDARSAERDLIEDGYDTYLRPTAAFSTLGWFSDPILSTFIAADDVALVSTIVHELTHVHLFVPGQVQFNESFAQFAGLAGAAEFFCTREGSGPDSVKCERARARWRDAIRFSGFLDGLTAELQALYADELLPTGDLAERREALFARQLQLFRTVVQPSFEASTYGGFLDTPLNNATLLARTRYYHRLADFEELRVREGGLRAAVEWVSDVARDAADPFEMLPRSRDPVRRASCRAIADRQSPGACPPS